MISDSCCCWVYKLSVGHFLQCRRCIARLAVEGLNKWGGVLFRGMGGAEQQVGGLLFRATACRAESLAGAACVWPTPPGRVVGQGGLGLRQRGRVEPQADAHRRHRLAVPREGHPRPHACGWAHRGGAGARAPCSRLVGFEFFFAALA